MYGNIQKLIEYIKAFGIRGIWMAFQAVLSKSPIEFRLKPPLLSNPVRLRSRSSDVSTYWQVIVLDEYQLTLPAEPEIIVDAGANIGLSTAVFASRHPDAKVIALEPDRDNLERLKLNVAGYTNVTIDPSALWTHSTTLPWIDIGLGNVGYRIGETTDSSSASVPRGTVQSLSVPDILTKYGIDRISILKMDIEGAENCVLENAGSWLSKVDMLVVEFHDMEVRRTLKGFEHLATEFGHTYRSGENNIFSRTQGSESAPKQH